MGKVKVEPQQSKNTTNHFSHPHPLELITNQNFASSSSQLCSGCKIQAIGSIYTCKSCNFFLHIECSQMPQQITHPFDKEHHFTLLPKPIYPEGNFNCDACGENGDGFSYHCKTCGTDLHILCAVFPLCVTHWSHHHQLDLKFSPPYPDKSFCCDICKNVGNNHWLYRCQTCGFDAHLNCTKLQAPPDHTHIHHNPTTSSAEAPQQQQHFTGINHMNQGIDSGPAVPQFWSRQNNEMAAQEILRKQSEDQQKLIQEMFTAATARQNQLIQQHIAATSRQNQDIYQQIMAASARQNQEINQQLTQALMNNASAGGVPMPNLYQNMMGGLNNAGGVNVLQAFSGGGGGGGIGGGSGGMELLQSLMGGGSGGIGGGGSGIGGGGGGMELLQSLMGSGSGGIGGGSGGIELLQSLMGGSSGGTGGLDLTALFGSLNF